MSTTREAEWGLRLSELLEKDVAGQLKSRMKRLKKKRRTTLDETFQTLDSLIDSLDKTSQSTVPLAPEEGAPPAEDEDGAAEAPVIQAEAEAEAEAGAEAEAEAESTADDTTESAEARADLPKPEGGDVASDVEGAVRDDYDEMEARGAQGVSAESKDLDPAVDTAIKASDDESSEDTDEETTPGWTRRAELLFDDALRLFRFGDRDGAMISLERLLASTVLNDDLQEFVRVNESKLMDLYSGLVGPFEKTPVRVEGQEPQMPSVFLEEPKIQHILSQVDGNTSMSEMIESGEMSPLETVAVINQLLRTRTIAIDGDVPESSPDTPH